MTTASLTGPLEIGKASLLATWSLVQGDTAGDAMECPDTTDACVTMTGTFDSGTVVLQGSNDGTNWLSLTDPQGNAISKTSAAIEQISEVPRYLRPSVSGQGASAAIKVMIKATGARR